MSWRRAALGAFAIALSLTSFALAEPVVQARRMGIELGTSSVSITYSAADLLNQAAREKLESGLPQRIVAQHLLYEGARGEPVAVGAHSCKVVYDLWQAVYRVEYELLGSPPVAAALRTRAEVIERCLVLRSFPIRRPSAHRPGAVLHVAGLIELNPLSTTTIARIRRWLSRPRGEFNVETKSFFGSFVSLFVNDRIGAAERVLRVRSQDVSWR